MQTIVKVDAHRTLEILDEGTFLAEPNNSQFPNVSHYECSQSNINLGFGQRALEWAVLNHRS